MEAEAPAAAMDTGQGRDNHVLVERTLSLPLNSCSSDQVDSTSGDLKASRPSHESRMSPEQVQCSTKVTQCGSCRTEFDTSKAYLEHVCCGEARPCKRGDGQQDGSDNSSISDVENFTGKIVYNPDGSAYIIEGADSELSDDECSLDLPQQEGCIVDARGVTPSPFRVFPQVVNALHISRNPALYSALYGQAYSLLQEKKKVPEVPVMHSYRVFTMRDRHATESGTSNDDTNLGSTKHSSKIDKSNFPILDYATVPIKPILMCFICKLSFGYAKSFVAHAVGEHNITLVEEEREVMSQKNTSAVIQGVGKDKEPLLSFLEPIPTSSAQVIGYPKFSSAYYVPNSSCPSSFASKDPVTTVFLNAVNTAVSSAMRGGYSAAVTTLVSATSSPVSSSMPEISASKSSSLTRHTLGGPDSEVLAPELEDLANIEKMAKAAAAAAAEASGTRPPSSPMSDKQHEKESSPNGHIEETDSSDVRSNLFAFGSGNLSRLERPTSTGSTDSTSPGVRMSPKGLITPSPVVPTCHSPAPSTSSPVCVQHPEGKPNGVECSKCDMVMGVNRSLGTQMTMMHSRNSCKTLKCPKCNWHYKYQETLEIHMKEKHPENEMSCIYCLTNQPHPRLARGETYTCGYKPYRCEVCNYSTTTKGNLSIHMQSDKHINNVQELQNGNISTDHMLQPQGLPAPPLPDPMKKAPPTNKPKATWRCDVCNYETNVARNLRIHMTSEKHTHNMMVLQQNVKHMQQFTAFQQAQALDPLFQFHPGLLLPCDAQLQPEAALADMAYNHALLMMATQQQQQQQQQRAMAAAAAVAAVSGTGKSTLGPPLNVGSSVDMEQGDTALRTDVPYDDSHKLFQCCVCNVYSADNIENLNQHMQQDRTWQREEEVLMAVAGSYICKLCTYKTNLKANFQLHCKTDKHLQKLQHFNHVKEGGPVTEWKLKYMNVNNPVQVRCNACDYYTNSIHKLQLHTANPRHETSSKLFLHLQIKENSLNIENKYYSCKLCHFFTRTKLNLIQHVHSLRHLRNDNIRQMQLKTEGRDVSEDIFLVKEYKGNEKIIFDADVDTLSTEVEEKTEEKADSSNKMDEASASSSASMLKQALLENPKEATATSSAEEEIHSCPFCNYTSNSDARLQSHIESQHSQKTNTISCPLCQESFNEWKQLESHLMEVHHVNQEGVQRLLLMVDQSDWISSSNKQSSFDEHSDVKSKQQEEEKEDVEEKNESEGGEKVGGDDVFDELPCSGCTKMFSNVDDLFSHQNELGHLELKQTPRGPGYLCWKKGCSQYFTTALALQMHFREIHAQTPPLAVSERHVYKYRCNQCSLAFKTLEKLQLHSQYHAIRAATQCVLCGRNFRSVAALQKHVESFHTDMSKEELDQYRASLANNPLLVGGNGGGVLDPQTTELLKKESNRDDEQQEEQAEAICNQDDVSPETEVDVPEAGDQGSSDGPKDQEGLEDYINSQSVAEDSYNDPTRKYKCHRCKVAFTRQSYLTSHNKTLLHRKGEKLSYPMEKYLDPNRPYKCDICMESFTQKNILLVHYNSVSHLHKLKQSMKESSSSSTSSTTITTTTASINSSTTTSAASTTNTTNTTSTNDSYNKPYKCNICKVAYSQGSTLDIHIRSVLHQTRASKLHELAMTGQVDLNVPLIEKPEPNQVQDTAENIQCSSTTMPQLTQVISPSTSVPSTTQIPKLPDMSEVPLSSTATTGSTPVTSASPQLSVPPDLASLLPPHSAHLPVSLSSQPILSCQRCSAIFVSQEALLQHQQLCCLFSQPSQSLLSRVSAITTNSQMPPIPGITPPQLQVSDLLQQKDDQDQSVNLLYPPEFLGLKQHPPQLSPQLTQHLLRAKCQQQQQPFPRSKPLIYKHLLESFGFDVVMQFNEYRQKYMQKEDKKELIISEKVIEEKEKPKSIEVESEVKYKDTDLPEINRSVCTKCLKEFSSIWVLKAHREEIHGQIVPVDLVEKFADEFRIEYEKRVAQSPTGQEDTGSNTDVSSPAISAESTVCPTPSLQTSLALSMSATPPTVSLASQSSDVNSTANQMAAQLQFNQLLMSMGLGMGLPMGMNMPFPAAMNLHPPLIPVMMPPPLDPLMASAFSHPMMPGTVDPNFFAAQQKLLQQQQQQLLQAQQQQKRARTRISDEQLKILRAYFDINNSPTEEQLVEMSEKSGLPLKVIKHWFRNTLFKERQRNKDSPYNFSNPPSTYLNLEEYEKTGETKVVPISKDDNNQNGNQSEQSRFSSADETDSSQEGKLKQETSNHSIISEEDASEQKLEGLSLSHPSDPSLMTASLADSVRLADPSSSSHPLPSFSLPSSTCTSPSLESAKLTNTISSSGMCTLTTNTSNTSSGSGKRANRTRFTDYQIKVLQEFFETNAYPKDDDLEYLSKMLNLSPRVIVVWFQNARQKARKVYENQPPVATDDDSSGKFQRTPGLNYQCKKCLQVFQRYYELIKHQKSSCFKDENPLSSQLKPLPATEEKSSSPTSSSVTARSPEKFGQNGTYRCDKCSLAFPRSDLWREHQIVHIMNPTLFPNYSSNSSFGILQYEAQQQSNPSKRKLPEEEESKESVEQPKDKRLRTTILPEQLDYLYQKYQMESNPSRKMLENIAREVGLKKRVVQVWFQNTRARERKGQFRAHQQVIHKRCPFCRALFKARSALESHLATRHADQYTKGDINIDALPDGDADSNQEAPSASGSGGEEKGASTNVPTSSSSSPSVPSTSAESVQNTMKKYYEDSLKKYLNDLCNTSKESSSIPADLTLKQTKPGEKKEGGDCPLDLSKSMKMSLDLERSQDDLLTSLSDKSMDDGFSRSIYYDDTRSETHSESTDNMELEDVSYESNPTSPAPSHSPRGSGTNKRFRTQMTTMQLKVMKSIFADYKTPSMAECEMLGREIGLPKRVVQVWFQNARAKEKKSKLAFVKTFGQEMEVAKLPDKCKFCNVKYDTKYSNTIMQDHLFSKRHIDQLKAHIDNMKKLTETQDAAERPEISTPGTNALEQLVQQQEFERASSQTNLMQQLQMMGLQQMAGLPIPMNLPPFGQNASMMGMNLGSGNREAKGESATLKQDNNNGGNEEESKSPSEHSTSSQSVQKHQQQSSPQQQPQQQQPQQQQQQQQQQQEGRKKDAAQIQASQGNPIANHGMDFPLPTSEAANLFPYMYTGFPNYYSGVPGSLFHPAMYQGTPQSGYLYDSNMYSTPLSLLHLPPTVLPEVTQQLTQPGNSTVRFFQDGKSLEDSKQLLSEVDLQHINEADVDIGFVCKKCQMVFPSEVLCLNHQKSSCFVTKVAGDIKAMLKLVQIQMECGACRERFTTVMDLRFHCSLDRHVKRIQRENIPIPPVSSNTSVLGPSTSIHSVLEASSANVPLAIREPSSSLPLSSLRGCSTLRGLHPTLGGSLTSSSPTQGGTASIQSPAIESPFLLPSTNQPQINCSESNPINCTSPIFQQDRLDAPVALDNMMVEQGQEPHSVNIPVSDRMLSKAGICNSGDASFSPETKRL